MQTLLEEIKQRFDFQFLDKIVIPGHSTVLLLNKYFFEIEETEDIEPIRIIISEIHNGKGVVIENCFRLSIVNCAENDEPHDLFTFYTFGKLHRFV